MQIRRKNFRFVCENSSTNLILIRQASHCLILSGFYWLFISLSYQLLLEIDSKSSQITIYWFYGEISDCVRGILSYREISGADVRRIVGVDIG